MSAVAIPTPVPSPNSEPVSRPGERKRWTVEQYLALSKAGFIHPDERVELLEGEIIHKMGQNPPHIVGMMLLVDALRATVGAGFRVDSQIPVLAHESVPEPDVVVLRGSARDFVGRYPGVDDVRLVAEVSDSTLVYDRSEKVAIYARAGFGEYWILNVTDHQLEIHRNPLSSGIYGEVRVYRSDESVPIEGRVLPVADLLP